MRFAALLAAALLLGGCAWVKEKLPWALPAPAPVTTPPTQPAPKPEPTPKPRPHVERPPTAAPVAAAPTTAPPVAAAPAEESIDYAARCRTMAANRADDAKGLGASAADQTKMRDETYHDCMQQSVK